MALSRSHEIIANLDTDTLTQNGYCFLGILLADIEAVPRGGLVAPFHSKGIQYIMIDLYPIILIGWDGSACEKKTSIG